MVKLRFTRTGRKNYATFRLVATQTRTKRDTKAIEELGYYLPHDKKSEFNAERVKYWLSVGAQPSPTVARMLVKAGILDKKYLPKAEFKSEPGRKAKARAEAKSAKAAVSETPAAEAESAEPVAEETSAAEPTAETETKAE